MKKNRRLVFLNLTAQHLLKNHLINAFINDGVEITPAHTGILFSLLEGQKSMNDLSELLNVKNSTITGLVDRLEKKGFVKRVSDPKDRRKWNIVITDSGTIEIKKASKVISSINNEICEGYTDDELDSFTKILKGMIDKF
ncbi:MAG: MarR family transcriptional regulator [Desulfobacterales bacterium]|nr:MarR family transcriptional regulator [Desulfobacterales bacterium]MCP4159333.1 MarR family transcriptional regulator [Deltaproteobacteria bacterium]